MSEKYPHIIETPGAPGKNRFPILLQLGVLSLVMLGLFGAAFWSGEADQTTTTEVTPVPLSNNIDQQPIIPQKLEGVVIRAKAAYVWDIAEQRALYAKNEDTALPLASITKLMTALLAYELTEDETETTVPLSAIRQEGNSGLMAGESLGIAELRELALITSSNDAAYTLGASVGALLGEQDPTSQFIRGMNIRAEELNLPTLDFKNTTGLDLSETEPGAVGSARDVSFLMEYIVTRHPEIIAPTQQTATRIYNTAGAYHEADNTNEVAREIPNMIGSKTGFTDLAGGNLTVAFDAGYNRPVIITVLGSTRDERFSDMLTLIDAVQQSLGNAE